MEIPLRVVNFNVICWISKEVFFFLRSSSEMFERFITGWFNSRDEKSENFIKYVIYYLEVLNKSMMYPMIKNSYWNVFLETESVKKTKNVIWR